jgi:heavy metal sensor kinase
MFEAKIVAPAQSMSLRLRLTLWYSGVLASVVALFGLAVYFVLDSSLTRQVDQVLHDTAQQIVANSSATSVYGIATARMPDLEDGFATTVLYAQIWQTDFSLVTSTPNLAEHHDPLDARSLHNGQTGIFDAYNNGHHIRVLTARIQSADGQVLGYLQIGANMGIVDSARQTTLAVITGGGLIAMVIATLIGWLAASRALRPLSTITATAQRISRADDLSMRIPVESVSSDEVGRLSMAFNQSMERLERLFKTQRRFLADVSHELRTPLTAIRGNVDLMQRMGTGDPESLRDMRSEVERMSRLVGDLLLLAQADSGNLPLNKTNVELDTLLLEVARETRVLSHTVTLTVGEIDQAIVVGDRDRLKQVLLNLVVNALKYTPDGGRVTLGLAQVDGQAKLAVIDTGVGISAEDQVKIFDRFYRVDKARSRAMGGAGLGLSIALRIAQMHGGRIELASEGVPGKGSIFTIWLPLKESDPIKARPQEGGLPRASEAPSLRTREVTR